MLLHDGLSEKEINGDLVLVQQEYGIFSLDLVIRYKVFFLMNSCTIGIVFQESD